MIPVLIAGVVGAAIGAMADSSDTPAENRTEENTEVREVPENRVPRNIREKIKRQQRGY